MRLDGVDIGNVESIKMVPRTPGHIPEKSRNIELILRVDKRFQPEILTDSTAKLVTEGLLGNRYVNITRGFSGVQLKENQELPGTAEQALSDVLSSMQGLTTDAGRLEPASGTLGKLLTDDQAYNNRTDCWPRATTWLGIQQGRGTLGKLVHPRDVR